MDTPNGSIEPNSRQIILVVGQSQDFVVTPKYGYTLSDWGVMYEKDNVETNGNILTVTGRSDVPLVQIQPTIEPIKSQLKFNPNGGSTPEASRTITYGSKLEKLPTPSREGHTFKGWFVNEQEWLEGQTVSAIQDVTAVARWSVNSYQLRIETTTGIKGIYYTIGDQTTRYNTGSVSESVQYGTSYTWYAVPEDGYETEYTLEHPMTGMMEAEAKTYVLKAKPKTITVYFDPGIGTCDVESKTVNYNEAYGDLPTPVSSGFAFVCWETSGRDRISSNSVVKLTSDATLTARWAAKTFEITGAATNGRVSVYPSTVEYGKSVEIKWTPNSESGYDYAFVHAKVYAGSDTNGICLATYTEGTGALYTLTTYYDSIHAQVTYARTPKAYTVTFDGNNGTSSAEEMTAHYQEPYGTLPTATRVGYDFDGWSMSWSGSSRVVATDLYARPSDSVLYARWRAKTYAVSVETTYCSLSVTTNGQAATRGTYDQPLHVSATPDSRTGYQTHLESVMIYSSANPSAAPIKSISSPDSFYMNGLNAYYEGVVIRAIAVQTPQKYRVSFDLNGGTGSADAMEVTYDAKYGKLPVATRVGYDFVAWRLEDGTRITEDAVVQITANSRLTAEWQAKSFVVTFDPQTKDVEAPQAMTVTYDAPYGSLPELTRKGFAFDGWFADETTAVTAETKVKITENQTLLAHWTANRYTIHFDANGGQGVMDSLPSCAYDEKISLPKCAFKHPTLTFVGWSPDAAAAKPAYADEDTVQGLIGEGEVTLFAIWLDRRDELSKACHCVNCTVTTGGDYPFTAVTNAATHETAIKSGRFSYPETCLLSVKVEGPGTFSLKWRIGEGDPSGKFLITPGELTPAYRQLEDEPYQNDGEWRKLAYAFDENGEKEHTLVLYSLVQDDQTHILLDELVWTPAGENPAPTEADRPVIGVNFAFTTDARFDYVVWTTESLESPIEWTPGETVPGDGTAFTLPIRRDADGTMPQRFYKVEVRQRQN